MNDYDHSELQTRKLTHGYIGGGMYGASLQWQTIASGTHEAINALLPHYGNRSGAARWRSGGVEYRVESWVTLDVTPDVGGYGDVYGKRGERETAASLWDIHGEGDNWRVR